MDCRRCARFPPPSGLRSHDPHEPQGRAHGYRRPELDRYRNVPEVVEHVQQTKAAGKGVISMKLIGEGAFTNRDDRKAAMRFAFRNAGIDCATVGYKNTAEIDEAIDNLNLALG